MRHLTVRQRLKRLITTRKKARLTRPFPGEPFCNGFVLGLSKEWVLMHQFHDFTPDGYTTVRFDDISQVRSGRYERVWERMLAGEGTLDHVGLGYEVNLNSTCDLLTSLQSFERNVIVECEDQEDSDNDEFYIGRIIKVEDDLLGFVQFDALGNWEDDALQIPLSEITKIQFDTPYINIFSKYLPAFEPQLRND